MAMSVAFVTVAFPALMELEGGANFTKLSGDPGGRTCGGVTEKWYPTVFNELLTEPDRNKRLCILRRFYWQTYWLRFGCDAIGNDALAYEMFETSVHGEDMAREIEEKVIAFMGVGSLHEAAARYDGWAVVVWNTYQWMEYRERRSKKPQFYAGWLERCFDQNLILAAEAMKHIAAKAVLCV